MKILVVDDEETGRLTLTKTLEHLGFNPATAKSGEEAWAAFQKNPYNVVISDWLMPGMDGIELCQRLRKIPTSHYTYFILVSVAPLESGRYAEATAEGIDDFLIKPLNPTDISNRLLVAKRILSFTSEIKRLKSLLPICLYCHKVRHDADYWQQVERFIQENTGSSFSHGICPDCFKTYVQPEMNKRMSPPTRPP